MTLLNRLLAQAKSDPPPAELLIPAHRVRQIAEHARLTQYHNLATIDEIERGMLEGKMKLLSIPVRVVGRRPPV